MEIVGDADWAAYLQLWEEYERAVEAATDVWMPGGACALHPHPVKATRETCTQEKIASLKKNIAAIISITAVGSLIMDL